MVLLNTAHIKFKLRKIPTSMVDSATLDHPSSSSSILSTLYVLHSPTPMCVSLKCTTLQSLQVQGISVNVREALFIFVMRRSRFSVNLHEAGKICHNL